MRSSAKLANAPTSWGIEAPLKPAYPTWSTVLDEVAAAGYAGVELGPYGFLPTEANELTGALRGRELTLVAGTVMEAFHRADERPQILEKTEQIATLLASQGSDLLVVIFAIVPEREATAGRDATAPRLKPVELETAVETIEGIATIARQHGIKAVLHPHAGTHLEFMDEIDLLARELPNVSFCVDTGHAAYAGIDAELWIDSIGDRLGYVHLKDIDAAVREETVQLGRAYWDAYAAGIFCILGDGVNDFERVFAALDRADYEGWFTVEQDAMPGSASNPLESAVANRHFIEQAMLRSAGGRG